MSCPESEEVTVDAALPPPGFTMLTKHICNEGACHCEPDSDAEGTDAESDSDVEKKFDESTGNLA